MTDQATLREQIADSLRQAIVNGALKPGQRVQEIEIAAEYKTSRTPVREALRQLESEGFLHIRPRRGAIVAPITEKDIREFYELKGLLESYAAERAVEYITPDEVERMAFLNRELKELYERGDVQGMLRVHNEFHDTFVKAFGNERLTALVKGLVTQYQRFRIALSHTDAVLESIREHDQIVEAFRARDPKRAAETVKSNSEKSCISLVAKLHGESR